MADRRRSPRSDRELDLLLFREGRELSSGLVMNLSSHGFMARLQAPVGLGPVDFRLEVFDSSIAGPGEVVWSQRERSGLMVGVRILRLSRKDARRLRRLVNPRSLDRLRAFWYAVGGVLCGLLIGVLQDFWTESPVMRALVIEMFPNALALGIMGLCVVLFLRVRDD